MGEGGHAPGDSPVCEVAPSGRGRAAGSGWCLFWSPGCSRPSFELARKVLGLNPIVHLTGSQGARQGCFCLGQSSWVVSRPTLLVQVLLGSPQQCCLINLHIPPATPLFFWLRPEGGAGEWDCPAW